jgi:hypothetical protein
MRDPDDLDEAADELRDALRTGDAVQVGGATYYREDDDVTQLTATVTVYRSRSLLRGQRWWWRLTSDRNGQVLATSAEGYHDKAQAHRMAWRVFCGTYRIEVQP